MLSPNDFTPAHPVFFDAAMMAALGLSVPATDLTAPLLGFADDATDEDGHDETDAEEDDADETDDDEDEDEVEDEDETDDETDEADDAEVEAEDEPETV